MGCVSQSAGSAPDPRGYREMNLRLGMHIFHAHFISVHITVCFCKKFINGKRGTLKRRNRRRIVQAGSGNNPSGNGGDTLPLCRILKYFAVWLGEHAAKLSGFRGNLILGHGGSCVLPANRNLHRAFRRKLRPTGYRDKSRSRGYSAKIDRKLSEITYKQCAGFIM